MLSALSEFGWNIFYGCHRKLLYLSHSSRFTWKSFNKNLTGKKLETIDNEAKLTIFFSRVILIIFQMQVEDFVDIEL